MDLKARRRANRARLQQLFIGTFSNDPGEQVLEILKNATLFRILPETATAEQLLRQEGKRELVAEIMQIMRNVDDDTTLDAVKPSDLRTSE